MNQTSVSPFLTSFLAGVAATLAAGVVIRRVTTGKHHKPDAGSSSTSRHIAHPLESSNDTTDTSTQVFSNVRDTKSTDLMDSPDLDLRLIRKAEAVIQMRSGSMTVVIERSTNSWNHSACLRTAEALVRLFTAL